MIKGPLQRPFFLDYVTREKRRMKREERRDELFESLEPLIGAIGMALIELDVFHGKKSVRVKAVVMSGGNGVEDCAKAHRLLMPRLGLAFPGRDVNLEVSSPGIDRLIKDANEFAHYIGREVKCYRADIGDWTAGVLRAAGADGIVLLADGAETALPYETIAKARLAGRR